MATVEIEREQWLVLYNISWKTYECLLDDREGCAPRFTYDRGTLEIMSPLSPEHEGNNHNVSMIVEIAAEEMGVNIRPLGSTTFSRENLHRGWEPDSCFYIQNEDSMRGKEELDPRVDPPPDLVVEIDITRSSLDKLAIYAQFGVPEVWRYNRRRLEIRLLEGDQYVESAGSSALPGVTADAISWLMEASRRLARITWLRQAREWARGLGGTDSATT